MQSTSQHSLDLSQSDDLENFEVEKLSLSNNERSISQNYISSSDTPEFTKFSQESSSSGSSYVLLDKIPVETVSMPHSSNKLRLLLCM